jgi:hypothetical protein
MKNRLNQGGEKLVAPGRVWVAEIMAVAREHGLVRWKGEARPDEDFAVSVTNPDERCGFVTVRRN